MGDLLHPAVLPIPEALERVRKLVDGRKTKALGPRRAQLAVGAKGMAVEVAPAVELASEENVGAVGHANELFAGGVVADHAAVFLQVEGAIGVKGDGHEQRATARPVDHLALRPAKALGRPIAIWARQATARVTIPAEPYFVLQRGHPAKVTRGFPIENSSADPTPPGLYGAGSGAFAVALGVVALASARRKRPEP